jgi:hypothetical protein
MGYIPIGRFSGVCFVEKGHGCAKRFYQKDEIRSGPISGPTATLKKSLGQRLDWISLTL